MFFKRMMELDADENHHKFIFLEEAVFNLAKTRRRGRNLIGHWAIDQVPGQQGANITICETTPEDGVLGHRPCIGPYNTVPLAVLLVIVWDNVQFHHAQMVHAWFREHSQFITLYILPFP